MAIPASLQSGLKLPVIATPMFLISGLVLAVVVLTASSALALPQADSGGPTWKTPPRPTSSDYPRAALRQSASGRVAVRCEVVVTGRPANCVVEAETPPGLGFGQAAIRIVSRARLKPETIRPEDIGTTFVVTVPFG